jgi:hypothetical protein
MWNVGPKILQSSDECSEHITFCTYQSSVYFAGQLAAILNLFYNKQVYILFDCDEYNPQSCVNFTTT